MTRRDCTTAGHVTIDHDPECIACGNVVTTDDYVSLHIDRERTVLAPDDIATPGEWGPLGTGTTATP